MFCSPQSLPLEGTETATAVLNYSPVGCKTRGVTEPQRDRCRGTRRMRCSRRRYLSNPPLTSQRLPCKHIAFIYRIFAENISHPQDISLRLRRNIFPFSVKYLLSVTAFVTLFSPNLSFLYNNYRIYIVERII